MCLYNRDAPLRPLINCIIMRTVLLLSLLLACYANATIVPYRTQTVYPLSLNTDPVISPFTDVELVLTDTELEGATYPEIRFGSCASKTVKLNIQYDEPCVDIRITDPSERFTNN